nr:cholinesterase-like [Rhipicephalus microplus]
MAASSLCGAIQSDCPSSRVHCGCSKLLKLLPVVTLVVTLVTFVAFVVAYKNRQERPACVVQTHESQVEGRAVMVEGVQVVEFLAIPFAESTAGSNRFRRPLARALPRKLNARRLGPSCFQRSNNASSTTATSGGTATTAIGSRPSASDGPRQVLSSAAAAVSETLQEDLRCFSGVTPPAHNVLEGHEQPSEDCLHLNIWVPHVDSGNASTSSDSAEAKEHRPKKPVVVFFHGGGFQEGSNSDPRYDGRYLSALGGLVVVVPNYRVGPLGFISSGDEDEPGNLALLDQMMALDWVRSHIDDFDGDPGCIVVAGAGSGASSLALHLLSPEAQGTMTDLRRFMLHSPSAFGPFADQSVPRRGNATLTLLCDAQSQQSLVPLARSVGCSGTGTPELLRCLRTVSADTLALIEPAQGGPFEPTFESQYLPDTPSGLLLKIPPFRKQVLLGNVADEGLQEFSAFNETLPFGISPDVVLHKFLPRELAKHGVHDAESLLRVYLNDTTGVSWDETQSLVSHLLGDLLYVCPTTVLAQYLSWGFENQVYTFRMNQRLSYSATKTMTRYEDVDLLFGLPLRQPRASEAEKSFSREIIRAWSNFAKFGSLPVVNDSSTGTTIEWPVHSDSEHVTVDISASGFNLVPDEHRGHCLQMRALAAADVV